MKKVVSFILAVCILFSLSLVSFCATAKEADSQISDMSLESFKVDKSRLSQAISTATSYYMSLDNFTGYSWSHLLSEIDDASYVNRDKNATQAQVNLATQELFDAIDGLVRYGENGYLYMVFLDVSSVVAEDEYFWAFIWNEKNEQRWEQMILTDTGTPFIFMESRESAVFTRMKKGEQPDWHLVSIQTGDTYFSGEYNCAVLNYNDDYSGMTVTWKDFDNKHKYDLIDAMFKAENYLFNESQEYPSESLFDLQNAYLNAVQVYKTAKAQADFELATHQLLDSIASLEGDDELVGDVDGNGDVSVMDATMIQRHLARLEIIDETKYSYADFDKDGKITVLDATMIQRYVAQFNPEL